MALTPTHNTYAIRYGYLPFGGLAYTEVWADTLDEAVEYAHRYARMAYRMYLEGLIASGAKGITQPDYEQWKAEIESVTQIAAKQMPPTMPASS